MVLNQSVSAQPNIEFTGIPANVKNLEIRFDLTLATNNQNLQLQFYNSSGVLDTASDYVYNDFVFFTNSTTLQSNGVGTSIVIGLGVGNSSSVGCSGDIAIQNIQGTKAT
jgi:hypothetical protein